MANADNLPQELIDGLERLVLVANGEAEFTEAELAELNTIFAKGEALGEDATMAERVEASKVDLQAYALQQEKKFGSNGIFEDEDCEDDDLLTDDRVAVSNGHLRNEDEYMDHVLTQEGRRRRHSEMDAARLNLMGQPPNLPLTESMKQSRHKDQEQLINRGRTLTHSKGLTGGYGSEAGAIGGGGVGGSAVAGSALSQKPMGRGRGGGRGGGGDLFDGGRGRGRGGPAAFGTGNPTPDDFGLDGLQMGDGEAALAYKDAPTCFFEDASEEANASVLRLLHDVHIHNGTDAYAAGVAKAQFEMTPCKPNLPEDHEHYQKVLDMCVTLERNPWTDAEYKKGLILIYEEELAKPPPELDEFGLPPYEGVMPNSKTWSGGNAEDD